MRSRGALRWPATANPHRLDEDRLPGRLPARGGSWVRRRHDDELLTSPIAELVVVVIGGEPGVAVDIISAKVTEDCIARVRGRVRFAVFFFLEADRAGSPELDVRVDADDVVVHQNEGGDKGCSRYDAHDNVFSLPP